MARKAIVRYYKPVAINTGILCLLGLVTLFSASLGQIGSLATFSKIMLIQLVGVLLGVFLIYLSVINKKIDYRDFYRKRYALYFFVSAVIFQLLVFTPLGVSRKGALRWIDVGITTVQPSELLKIALVVMLSTLLVGFKRESRKITNLVIILSSTMGLFIILMFLIRDKGSIIIAGLSCLSVLAISQVRKSHIIVLLLFAIATLGSLVGLMGSESYAKNRILSFVGLAESPLGQDYQVNQSIATIGSGKITGRGYGQSVQKHKYLPEPLSDSIFAVYAEEWGFIGSVLLVALYVSLAWFCMRVAIASKDLFGRYIVTGLTVLIISQSFFNIMALLKLVPLSGMPLVFISKGGTSVLTSLFIIAIILNVSRINYARL